MSRQVAFTAVGGGLELSAVEEAAADDDTVPHDGVAPVEQGVTGMDGTAEEERGVSGCGQLCPALLWTKMPDVAVQIPLPFKTEANERESWRELVREDGDQVWSITSEICSSDSILTLT